MIPSFFRLPWLLIYILFQPSLIHGLDGNDFPIANGVPSTTFRCQDQQWAGYYSDPQLDCQMFHICVHRNDKIDQFSFMCPNQTVFDQKLLVCVWLDNFDCSSAPSFYYVNEGVFEDLGNDFESPETRSEGRSLGLEGIGLEAEDLPLTGLQNDISTFGKSLSSDNNLETQNTQGILDEAKPQTIEKSFTDAQVLPNFSQRHEKEFNTRPTPKSKNLYFTTATTKASAKVKNEPRKITTQKEIRKKPKTDSKLLVKQDVKHNKNKLDIIKTTVSTSVLSNQPSLQPIKNPSTYLTSPAKGKELKAEIKTKQEQNQGIETATKPYLSITSSPGLQKISLGQIHPDEKSSNGLTTQPTSGNIWEKAIETTTKQPLENILSRTTLKVLNPIPSVGANYLPQNKPRPSPNPLPKERKKSSPTTNLHPTREDASPNNFNTKIRTGINKSNSAPHINKANSTSHLNINDQNAKSKVTSSKLPPFAKQESDFPLPPKRPVKEKLSSSPAEKSGNNLISQHKVDSANVQKALSSPISVKDSKQSRQEGENKEIFQGPIDHTKSPLINKSKQTTNRQRPSNIVRGTPKSVGERIESGNKIRGTNKKQDTGKQRNNDSFLRQSIKANANNHREKSIQKISKLRPKLTAQKGLNSGLKIPSNGLTAYGILQQLLQNVTIIRSQALTEAKTAVRGRNIRRNRTANFSNSKSFTAHPNQAVTPEQNIKAGNSEVRSKTIQNTQNEKSNDLSWTKAALYQTEDKGYLPLKTEEPKKSARASLENCAFDRHGKSKTPGCTSKTFAENNNAPILANQGFEIPVPSSKSLYSNLPYGGASKVQSNGRLPSLKVEKTNPLNRGTEKHTILNIPGNGVPPTLIDEQKKHQNQYLSPPPFESGTSSEDGAPVLIVSRAQAQNNGRDQKVYLNTIKPGVKKSANRGPYGAPFNLPLPEATNTFVISQPNNPLPTAAPNGEISWSHYVNASKRNSEKSSKGMEQ